MTKTFGTHTAGTHTSQDKPSAARRSRPALGLAGLLLLTACAGQATTTGASTGAEPVANDSEPLTVLLLGDSVAAGQAVALTAAFAASGARFRSRASTGGGNVVGPFADKNWQKLPDQIASADPSVVVYQITTYDWGTRQQQRAAYRRLLTTVADTGAKLIFVTMPPIKPDDFYRPHMAELNHAPQAAKAVAEASAGQADFLDAHAVWGDAYRRTRDGKPDRSADGIHTCPQGSARFANWLLNELAERYPDFAPADPAKWANTGWSGDDHFKGC